MQLFNKNFLRSFFFVCSLALLSAFSAAATYIFLATDYPINTADTPTSGQYQTDPAYQTYRAAADFATGVQSIQTDDELTIHKTYSKCGHTETSTLSGLSEFAHLTYDQLTAEGWDIAATGNHHLSLSRTYDELCPTDADCRLICRTERGIAVYQGTATHRGNMLLEMPLQFSEVPPDILAAITGVGYQLSSQDELNAVLESLDELAATD